MNFAVKDDVMDIVVLKGHLLQCSVIGNLCKMVLNKAITCEDKVIYFRMASLHAIAINQEVCHLMALGQCNAYKSIPFQLHLYTLMSSISVMYFQPFSVEYIYRVRISLLTFQCLEQMCFLYLMKNTNLSLFVLFYCSSLKMHRIRYGRMHTY